VNAAHAVFRMICGSRLPIKPPGGGHETHRYIDVSEDDVVYWIVQAKPKVSLPPNARQGKIPRIKLQGRLLEDDPTLKPLDLKTLKAAIDEYNADRANADRKRRERIRNPALPTDQRLLGFYFAPGQRRYRGRCASAAATYDRRYPAQHNLIGVAGDETKAHDWYQRASELGSTEAGRILARTNDN
jgi:TPR repeat protein